MPDNALLEPCPSASRSQWKRRGAGAPGRAGRQDVLALPQEVNGLHCRYLWPHPASKTCDRPAAEALFDTPGFVQGAQRSSPFIDPIGTSVFAPRRHRRAVVPPARRVRALWASARGLRRKCLATRRGRISSVGRGGVF